MRSNSSSVAGWLVPARGTCSRKLSSPSASTTQTGMSFCASASDRQSPTGPAPITTTRDLTSDISRSGLRHHVLDGAGPAGVGQVEHDAERILVLRLVERVRRGRPARQIGAARVDHFLLGGVEVVHPHAIVIDADLLLLALLLEERDVHHAVRHIDAAPRGAGALHVEGLLEELRGLFRIGNDDGEVAKLCHGGTFLVEMGSAHKVAAAKQISIAAHDERYRAAAVRALMLGAARDVDLRVSDQSGERAAHEGAGVTGRG